jgi:DNA-binding transcriptional MerR regulator
MSSALPIRSLMSIGEIIGLLRPDFPDVTISKIRFLESEGLVDPARTPSGYRKFSHADVERLRYVLLAQRDHYLPLRVIKAQLEALDRGDVPAPGRRGASPPGPVGAADGYGDARAARLTREQLVEQAGIDAELLDQIEEYGLIERRRRDGTFDTDARAIAVLASALRSYGLEPRHLRTFRTAAEREAGLIEQLVSPLLRQRSLDARVRAQELAREVGDLSLQLHAALVHAALGRSVGG